MNKIGVIFDMDGTLWDSSEQVALAWSQVLAGYAGLSRTSVSAAEVRSWMGKTMAEIAALMLPEQPQTVQEAVMDECGHRENELLRRQGGVLYPDVEKTLASLCSRLPLYIVSNCQSGYIEAFLEYYGFQAFFQDIGCYGDTGLGKAENIRLLAERNALTRSWYVGDTQGDYDAARTAGSVFIHAAYGFGTVKQDVQRITSFSDLSRMDFVIA